MSWAVVECEELRDFVLIGHSYGGMVATGVADRARDRVSHLIYLDAFVPKDGQALIDFVPQAQRERMRDSVKAGDGWRVAPNPTPPTLRLRIWRGLPGTVCRNR
jgi:Predicted hydrolases or acyltransferases (alpha/beta hydrolase superfamily)